MNNVTHMPVAAAWLAAADLPRAWQGQPAWTILDLDFSDGAVFAAFWQAWRQDAQRPTHLFYSALLPAWLDQASWAAMLDTLDLDAASHAAALAAWPWDLPGVYTLHLEQGRVRLDLARGPVRDTLPQRVPQAQTVLLPWSSGATEWSAGAIRAACAMLAPNGRMVMAQPAATDLDAARWPSMRDALTGAGLVLETAPDPATDSVLRVAQRRYGPQRAVPTQRAVGREALVIGAGLAGSAVAAALARRGWHILQLADPQGLPTATAGQRALAYHPSVTPDDAPISRLLRHALLWTHAHYDVGLARWHGRIQQDSAARCAAMARWPAAWVSPLSAAQASERAGLALRSGGGWWPRAGSVDPTALCQAWSRHPGIVTRHVRVARLMRDAQGWHALDAHDESWGHAPIAILATGAATPLALQAEQQSPGLPALLRPGSLQWRPGQTVVARVAPDTPALRCVVGAAQGGHALPWDDHTWVIGPVPGSTDASEAGPAATQALAHWARCLAHEPAWTDWTLSDLGWRLSTRDHLPLIGPLRGWPDLWVATALGGRGLLWSVLAAELIAAALHAEPNPLPYALQRSVDPGRFQSSR